MKIALACARIVDRDMEHNLAQMEKYMAKASDAGACLVCFGEAFLQGFNAFEWDYETDKNLAVSLKSNLFKRIRTMAGKYGIDVLFGYNELDGEKIYSSCALMTPEGIHHNYRRISRGWKEYWKTDDHYREGDCVTPFDYRGRKMVIGLCGDLWDYPDRFRLGEDVLIWPVYVDWTEEEWYGGGRQEYAEQAALCCGNVLYVNSVAENGAFGGALHFKNGSVDSELSINQEGMLLVEI